MEKPEIEYYQPVTILDGSQASEKDEPTWTEEEERAVRRKLDYHIVPLVTILYLLCFVRPSPISSTKENTNKLTSPPHRSTAQT